MPYFVCGIEYSIMAVNRCIDISNEMTCTYSLYAYYALYALMLSICCHLYSYLLFEVPFLILFLQRCIASNESSGIDIMVSIIQTDFPALEEQPELALELKV